MHETDVEKAEELVSELQGKHAAATGRATELSNERRKVAFDAHTGNAVAQTKLQLLNNQGAVIEGEIEALAFAVDEAKRRLSEARHSESAAEERARLVEARKRAAAARQCADDLQKAVDEMAANYMMLETHIRGLHEVGFAHPSVHQLRTMRVIALATGLIGAGMKPSELAELRLLAPSERHNFRDLMTRWTALADQRADAVLDAEVGEAA